MHVYTTCPHELAQGSSKAMKSPEFQPEDPSHSKIQSNRKRTANVYPTIGLVGVIPTLEKSVESENDLVGPFRFQLVFTEAERRTFVL